MEDSQLEEMIDGIGHKVEADEQIARTLEMLSILGAELLRAYEERGDWRWKRLSIGLAEACGAVGMRFTPETDVLSMVEVCANEDKMVDDRCPGCRRCQDEPEEGS